MPKIFYTRGEGGWDREGWGERGESEEEEGKRGERGRVILHTPLPVQQIPALARGENLLHALSILSLRKVVQLVTVVLFY